ncbi:hypothetical protein VTK26DRAFT_5621 [Humicola hyalothermophila]
MVSEIENGTRRVPVELSCAWVLSELSIALYGAGVLLEELDMAALRVKIRDSDSPVASPQIDLRYADLAQAELDRFCGNLADRLAHVRFQSITLRKRAEDYVNGLQKDNPLLDKSALLDESVWSRLAAS